jgi:hypothetical protein
MAKKQYRVVGESVVAGHQPGEEFSHEFTQFEEWHLIAAGAIALVKEGAKSEGKELE